MREELPAGLRRAWGLNQTGVREPRLGLSLGRVVDAAIELADAKGVEAVTMSRVAERLGFTPMSLYRHVQSKDELLQLMLNTAIGPPVGLDAPIDGWRRGLERWCRALLAVVQQHPWALRIPLGPMMGPGQLAWLDRGLQALADTDLTEHDKANVILLLNGHVFWAARLAADFEHNRANAAAAVEAFSAALSTLVDTERFPALSRAIQGGLFSDGGDEEERFAFGLERILDGVDRMVGKHATQADIPSRRGTASQPRTPRGRGAPP
jgi:AcrR family transcriptional regulator